MNQFQIKQKILVIRMPRELDHHSADFMDSSGIGVIMGRYQNVRLLGGSVVATHVNDRIYKVLNLAGLTKVIAVDREHFWNQGE